MSQMIKESTRTKIAPKSATATAKSVAQFEAARRNRMPAMATNHGVAVSLKDSAPGSMLIGMAIAEAILVEPLRSFRRKFRRAV